MIHDASSPNQWRHVPTEHNPADLASRGIKGNTTTTVTQRELEKWLNGPEFIWKQEIDWPSLPDDMSDVEDDNVEVKGCTGQVHALVNAVSKQAARSSLSELFHRCSCWYRLCKLVAWLIRFKAYLRWRYERSNVISVSTEPLSVTEVSEAENAIVKLVQQESFKGKSTSSGQSEVKYNYDRLRNLSPIMEDGIVRVGGRLANAPVEETFKHPVILPPDHHVTNLIIRHYHKQNGHVGSSQTLAAVRQKYWLIKGPSTVRKILNTCIPCRRQNQQAPTQIMAPLPRARVTPGLPPFSSVGIDYFGPLLVKYRRGTVKRYGCLFTCLAIRAVHIEVSSDLSTDSFIQAVCRFVSRRGPPREIYSDNGSNFRGAESEVKEALSNWNQGRIRERLRENRIQWYFNAPAASHTGGVWERMIRSTRRIIRAIVGNQLLDEETLRTTLSEVEKIINDRPLTPLSNDPKDMEVLTPNSLLLLGKNSSVPPCETTINVKLTERWRLSQLLADTFWKRWVAEYLPTLQEKQKWLRRQRNMSVGDLVLIRDDNVPRGEWPLGLVMETYPDKAGIVRRVLVRTTKGRYQRDIRKLCLLECSGDQE